MTNPKKQDLKSYILNFSDLKIRESLLLYINNDYFVTYKKDIAYKIIKSIPFTFKSSNINWQWLQSMFDSFKEEVYKENFCLLIHSMIKLKCYNGIYRNKLIELNNLPSIRNDLFWLFSNKLTPLNLILYKNSSGQFIFKTDISNLFLYNLIYDFISFNKSLKVLLYRYNEFIMQFEKSLQGKIINSISDFNIDTFNNQFNFFKTIGVNAAAVKLFYTMLLGNNDGDNIFSEEDGINIHLLNYPQFIKYYGNGHKLTYLNSFDPVPSYDKWLLNSNGFEKYSTKIKPNQYIAINFSTLKDNIMRDIAKKWFWEETLALSSRKDSLFVITKFCNYIHNLRINSNIDKFIDDNNYIFSPEEIFCYIGSIKLKEFPKSHIPMVKRFLKFINENTTYKIPIEIFTYFSTKKTTTNCNAKAISDDELIKIEKKFKNLSENNYNNTIYYIIFHIAISTELRISQILSLTTDCLITDLDGKTYLNSTTKVTKGEQIKVPISKYTKRFIELAIKFTNQVRYSCNNLYIKNYIFINKNNNVNYSLFVTRTFSEYLKRTCKKLNIEKYTASNLRDTYITKAIEYAMTNNLSLLETKTLTWHKKIDTATNNYMDKKLKEYLEAMHMIKIGDIKLNGSVQSTRDNTLSNDNLVNDECGFCSKCNKKCFLDQLPCLMCNGFIATIDRIPYFEKQIDNINNLIKSSYLNHDKEHLLSVKKLYVAYLFELLKLKEALKNG